MYPGTTEFINTYPNIPLDELCEEVYLLLGNTITWLIWYVDGRHILVVLDSYENVDAYGNDVNYLGEISVDGEIWFLI